MNIVEEIIKQIKRAKEIYARNTDTEFVKGKVAMCEDIIKTLELKYKNKSDKN